MDYNTRRLVADKAFTHEGRALQPGDTFNATPVDAGYLTRNGRAHAAPADVVALAVASTTLAPHIPSPSPESKPKPEPEPEPEPPAETGTEEAAPIPALAPVVAPAATPAPNAAPRTGRGPTQSRRSTARNS